jgi:hypothetical protein
MILLSLNVRGVGGPHKLSSLHNILNFTKVDIVFFQETLVDELKAYNFMCSLCPTWYICVVSAVGKSKGLLATWNPSIYNLNPFLSVGGILLTGIFISLAIVGLVL